MKKMLPCLRSLGGALGCALLFTSMLLLVIAKPESKREDGARAISSEEHTAMVLRAIAVTVHPQGDGMQMQHFFFPDRSRTSVLCDGRKPCTIVLYDGPMCLEMD